jgi:hypothetical protein
LADADRILLFDKEETHLKFSVAVSPGDESVLSCVFTPTVLVRSNRGKLTDLSLENFMTILWV